MQLGLAIHSWIDDRIVVIKFMKDNSILTIYKGGVRWDWGRRISESEIMRLIIMVSNDN